MIENLIEGIKDIYETAPTTLIAIPLLAVSFIGAGWAVYSLHKNPPKLVEEEANLTEEDYTTLRKLRNEGFLNEDKDKFYIDKEKLKPYDLERLAEE